MGGWPVGYLHNAAEELNSGPPRANPDSGRAEDLNQGPPDFKSSAASLDGDRFSSKKNKQKKQKQKQKQKTIDCCRATKLEKLIWLVWFHLFGLCLSSPLSLVKSISTRSLTRSSTRSLTRSPTRSPTRSLTLTRTRNRTRVQTRGIIYPVW